MARIIVAIELVAGARAQAACRTEGCTGGRNGRPWRGEAQAFKADAEDDATAHRQWHRRQLPVPAEPEVPDVA